MNLKKSIAMALGLHQSRDVKAIADWQYQAGYRHALAEAEREIDGLIKLSILPDTIRSLSAAKELIHLLGDENGSFH